MKNSESGGESLHWACKNRVGRREGNYSISHTGVRIRAHACEVRTKFCQHAGPKPIGNNVAPR